MLAFIYLILMCVLGDTICRRFFVYVSTPHRFATAFIGGLLISSWWTYLTALLFAGMESPMLWGNVVFFITAAALIFWLRRRPVREHADAAVEQESARYEKWDWILIGIFLVFTGWMMFSTFNVTDGVFKIGHHQFPDFGSTVSIMQSFAEGRNFPTEYPHFSGDRIRYHFLFYFQAGNLEYLGLDAALSNNILSVLSMTSMLALLMTLGRVVFDSRIVGRIGAALFFFHGSLAFIPFMKQQDSFAAMLTKLGTMTMFLFSGLPHRGEDWGVWSQNVYLNQRHLTSSIAVVLIALILLIVRYRQYLDVSRAAVTIDDQPALADTDGTVSSFEDVEPADDDDNDDDEEGEDDDDDGPGEERSVAEENIGDELDDVSAAVSAPADDTVSKSVTSDVDAVDDEEADEESDHVVDDDDDDDEFDSTPVVKRESYFASERFWGPSLTNRTPYIFLGVLLGLLPLWNGAIFTAAFVILAFLFVMFPLKRQMLLMGLVTGLLAIPQIYFLKSGVRPGGYSYFHWGYTIENAGIGDVLYYLVFTFGFKWLLIAVALYFASSLPRRIFIAISGLLVVAFTMRFSEELLVNHKFLNVWLVIANLFVGYGIIRLWRIKVAGSTVLTRLVAVVLTFLSVIGGVIDLAPIKNSYFVEMKHDGDKLVEWVKANTDPRAVFLSHRYINHQILLSGRRLFYGEPYYPWGAGYDTPTRDAVYRKMLESTDPNEVFQLLKENHIDYVAIDDQIRGNKLFVRKSNESIFKAYFKLVFEDKENRYANIKIYEVPDTLGQPDPNVALPSAEATPEVKPTANVDVFTGGVGTEPGQFTVPRGIVTDDKGNIFIADTGNARIQKFDVDGKFVGSYGTPGTGQGEIKEPNGIALDPDGNIFVTDAVNHKLVKYDPNGKFVKEWVPEGGFYGPRDIAFGPNKQLYIIDQGLTRIAKFDTVTESFNVWGLAGAAEGQFKEATGIAVANDMVYVADTGNQRIQVFDLNGVFVKQWPVPSWDPSAAHFPDIVFDEVAKRIFVTDGKSNRLLAFDPDGQPVNGYPGEAADQLLNPSSIYIVDVKGTRRLLILNTSGARVTAFDLDKKKGK